MASDWSQIHCAALTMTPNTQNYHQQQKNKEYCNRCYDLSIIQSVWSEETEDAETD